MGVHDVFSFDGKAGEHAEILATAVLSAADEVDVPLR
jgi:hypothetical protein